MKTILTLLSMLSLLSCNSKPEIKKTIFIIEHGPDFYDFSKRLYVRSYLNRKDTVKMNLSVEKETEIKKLFLKYNLDQITKNYSPEPKTMEIPSIPLKLLLHDTVSVIIEDGDYGYLEKRKVQGINSFYSEIFELIYQESQIKTLKPSDIIFF